MGPPTVPAKRVRQAGRSARRPPSTARPGRARRPGSAAHQRQRGPPPRPPRLPRWAPG